MTEFDLDALIEASAVTAQIAGGASPQWIMQNSNNAQVALLLARQVKPEVARHQPWSKEDYEFVTNHVGLLSDEEMGQRMGRSRAAIKVKRVRKGLGSVSTRDGYLSARDAAKALGVKCSKKVAGFVRDGLLKGSEAPLDRLFYQIHIDDLKRFACKPENWIYFDPKRVEHPEIRRLVLRQMRRWNDEWWTAAQVARYHGVDSHIVNHIIYKGRLPGRLYGKWYVRRSVAIAPTVTFPTGRGVVNKLICEQIDEFDSFMVVAVAVGLSYGVVEKLAGEPPRTIGHRYITLRRLGRLQDAAALGGYEVSANQDGDGWIHCGRVRGRFPFLDRIIAKFVCRRSCSTDERRIVAGVLESWARYHAVTEEQKETVRLMVTYSFVGQEKLNRLWNDFKTWGYGDPLCLEEEST